MAEPEDLDEDLFADLYEGDDNEATPAKPAPAPVAASTPAIPSQPATDPRVNAPPQQEQQQIQQESQQQSFAPADVSVQQSAHQQAAPAITTEHGFTGTVGMKEDGWLRGILDEDTTGYGGREKEHAKAKYDMETK